MQLNLCTLKMAWLYKCNTWIVHLFFYFVVKYFLVWHFSACTLSQFIHAMKIKRDGRESERAYVSICECLCVCVCMFIYMWIWLFHAADENHLNSIEMQLVIGRGYIVVYIYWLQLMIEIQRRIKILICWNWYVRGIMFCVCLCSSCSTILEFEHHQKHTTDEYRSEWEITRNKKRLEEKKCKAGPIHRHTNNITWFQ